MTLEESIKWCQEHLATVSFISVYNVPRVRVKPAGYPFQERNSITEAVEAARNNIRSIHRDDELHADCCGR